jgi:SPP1 gp7 family putative phage head morphogenesis protein
VGFAVSANPDRFDEAIEWFEKRLPVTRAQLAKLSKAARNRAWWISGVAQLDVVDQVQRSILKAIETGIPFEEWQGKIEAALTKAWGMKDSARVETIFRNATQHAYNAGRIKQLKEPSIAKTRPYWEFDAIDDQRLSPICRAANGTILPADDPWWKTHTPLLHHRCRSRIRALRTEQALRKGVTRKPTDTEAQDGFGKTPELDDWEPDLSKYPTKLASTFKRKTASAKKPKPRIVRSDAAE